MQLHVLCPRCFQPFEIDDADGALATCPSCLSEWVSNADAEPDPWNVPEYEFETFPDTSAEPLEAVETRGGAEDWQQAAARARPRRKEASLVSKMVPPILGGLSAMPIALAILWYGFGRDLGNAGPRVAKYVPWIVPEALRGQARGRFKTDRPTAPSRRSSGEFGPLGGKSEPSPSLDHDDPKSQPPPAEPREPSIDPDVGARVDAVVEAIQSLRDAWKGEPNRSWSSVQWDIYKESLRLAELCVAERQRDETARIATESFLELLRQPWYLESIENAMTHPVSESHPPEAFEYVLWPVRSMAVDSSRRSASLAWRLEPTLTIGDRETQWISSDTLRARILGFDRDSIDGRWLVVGRVERADELGYVIRVEAVLSP